jgi:3-oxoacyl-[acyl-carrier protein] reductase
MLEHGSDSQLVAIVTGGSGGIGRACAARLAHDGFAVVVNFGSNSDQAATVVADIVGAGGTALAAQGDVADEAAMARVFDTAEDEFGGVDVVVHTAARQIHSLLVDLDLVVLDSLHRTNIRGTFVVDQQAARHVRPGGAIINFSSSVLGTARPGFGAYAASKGAVEALTLTLAHELRSRDVTVNTVAPGQTETESFRNWNSQADIERFIGAIPLGRLAQPADLANVVVFLASPQGRWINGEVIRANGGLL